MFTALVLDSLEIEGTRASHNPGDSDGARDLVKLSQQLSVHL